MRNHGQVEAGGHPRLVDAGLLGPNEGRHILPPQLGRGSDGLGLRSVGFSHYITVKQFSSDLVTHYDGKKDIYCAIALTLNGDPLEALHFG